ncbi:DNA methyltransferase [Paenibacillus donghaensis]|uniref:MGMT family protein n=1 Tax=Paenibacillus TaxID=44249 RepID=UPI0018848536|nr:MGMT family protein [Paenibacillus donghaensis]MBE9914621.1 DNA methyltransferase [Paenibacillus donghaensis]
MQPFTQAVIEQIKSIPAGKVMTYGGIAAAAGSPRAARQVVRILHSMSGKYELPWHRVVNAKGEIALLDDESRFRQRSLLEDEGIEFGLNGRIDLSVYGA